MTTRPTPRDPGVGPFPIVTQSVLAPLIATMATRYASAFLGGVGLVSTFVALLVATTFTGGLEVTGGTATWIASVVLVGLVTALATWLLPFAFLRRRLQERQAGVARRGGAPPAAAG